MLKVINTKILAGIFAAVLAIGVFLVHEHSVNARAAAAAERAATLLQQQRDTDGAAKKHDAETWKFVQEQREKNNVNFASGSKGTSTYIP